MYLYYSFCQTRAGILTRETRVNPYPDPQEPLPLAAGAGLVG